MDVDGFHECAIAPNLWLINTEFRSHYVERHARAATGGRMKLFQGENFVNQITPHTDTDVPNLVFRDGKNGQA